MPASSSIRSFEELHVFQRSKELSVQIYTLTRQGLFLHDRDLTYQMRRASVSIFCNIAEGFERGTNAEFIRYLYISKGSCGELRAQILLAFDLRYIDILTYQNLLDASRRISGMLANLIQHIRTSPFRGNKPTHKPKPFNP